jgi:FkbM family methyltransferase
MLNVTPAGKKPSVAGRVMLGLAPDDYLPVLDGHLAGTCWLVHSHVHECVLGTYEPETQQAFVDHLFAGASVWDVGACCGYLTILACKLVGSTGHVLAVEPAPAAVASIRRHGELNNLDNITVLERAVSDSTGTRRFCVTYGIGLSHFSDSGSIEVETVTLDSLLEWHAAPDLLKIDVEGAEAAALAGAERVLSEERPTLLLSTHGRGNYDTCCRELSRHGYRMAELDHTMLSGVYDHLAEILALPV